MYATLSPEGNVTIPLEIRHRLNIGAGDKINFLVSERNVVRLVPERSTKSFAGMIEWRGKPLSLKDMDDAVGCGGEPGRH